MVNQTVAPVSLTQPAQVGTILEHTISFLSVRGVLYCAVALLHPTPNRQNLKVKMLLLCMLFSNLADLHRFSHSQE